MKVFLDTLGMDRPTNADLQHLGAKLSFYKGLPEMFEQFRDRLLTEEHVAHGITVEHYIISSGIKVMVLAVIVGIGSNYFSEFTNSMQGQEPSLEQAGSLMLASLALFGLGIFGPSMTALRKAFTDAGQEVPDHMRMRLHTGKVDL